MPDACVVLCCCTGQERSSEGFGFSMSSLPSQGLRIIDEFRRKHPERSNLPHLKPIVLSAGKENAKNLEDGLDFLRNMTSSDVVQAEAGPEVRHHVLQALR